MEEILNSLPDLLSKTITAVITSLYHNWIPLTLAILTAVLMKVYVDAQKFKNALLKRPNVSIISSVVFGAFTPLCACGTMSVVIGLLTTTLPWGPVMSFLTSSPLMSPDSFIMLTGIIGLNFAVALTVASVFIGLSSGYLTHVIEKKTGFLKNQTRFGEKKQKNQDCGCSESVAVNEPCGCSTPVTKAIPDCGCSESAAVSDSCACSETASIYVEDEGKKAYKFIKRFKLKEISKELYRVGVKQILLNFAIFIALGYLINSFVPTNVIMALFSSDNIFAIPLAALIGLPLYVSGEAAIPLINSLMDSGASGGAMLAFMITGQATSAWVIAGIMAFMKRRVITLYLGFIVAGGILCGYLYELYLAIVR